MQRTAPTAPASTAPLEVEDLDSFTTAVALVATTAGAQRFALTAKATSPDGRVRDLDLAHPPRSDDVVEWRAIARWRGRKARHELGRAVVPAGADGVAYLEGGVAALEQLARKVGRPVRFTGDLRAALAHQVAAAQLATAGAAS